MPRQHYQVSQTQALPHCPMHPSLPPLHRAHQEATGRHGRLWAASGSRPGGDGALPAHPKQLQSQHQGLIGPCLTMDEASTGAQESPRTSTSAPRRRHSRCFCTFGPCTTVGAPQKGTTSMSPLRSLFLASSPKWAGAAADNPTLRDCGSSLGPSPPSVRSRASHIHSQDGEWV